MSIWFTSDWHLGENRLGFDGKPNVFFRPFSSVQEQDETIINNINKFVKESDILYHLGDVLVDMASLPYLAKIKCKTRHLILGNYDDPIVLVDYFDSIQKSLILDNLGFNLVHKPVESNRHHFNIVGHIHSLWKVKRNMVNVGCDAWHFRPVSLDEILFVKNAIAKGYYDENVFFGEEE